jgi:outer membrane protein insertion porin family
LSIGRRLLPLVVLGVAGLGPARALAQEESLFGKTVLSVAYRCDGAVEKADVERLVTIRAGFPLTEDETARTVRNLFATRQFADVQVEGIRAEGGVDVVVLLFRAFRLYPLRFAGRRGLSREDLRRALPFFEGSVYLAADVEEGAAALQRRLIAEGFPLATVVPETRFDRHRFDAEVTYRIDSGERARVGPAIFLGPIEPYTAAELLAQARLKPGDRYRESKAASDATRMREFLHRQGRLKASVELIAAQPADNGRIRPVYRASVGSEVVFHTIGLKASRVAKQVHALLEGQVFDEDLILQYVEQQQQELQRKGYYRAKVVYSIGTEPDVITVTVEAGEGRKYAVERIAFEGNASVADKTLRNLLLTSARGLPVLDPGRLTDAGLKGDVDAVLGYYQTHGWIGAKVGPAEVTDGSKPGLLVLEIPIDEGPRTIVESRTIVGVSHVDTAELERVLSVAVGRPFNPAHLRQDVSAIQGFYQGRGWLEAGVREEYRLSADHTSAQVTYRIEEGARSFFGKTIVRGNTVTKTDRIRRLASWTEGAPFSEEKVLEAQRQLSRTGAFQKVDVRPEAMNPADHERNVQVEVQEARPLSLLYGFGYQYLPDAAENQNDPFVVGGVATRNLFGGMRSAGLEASIALSGRYRVQASYRDPFLFGYGFPFTSVLFAGIETIQNVNLERFGWVNEVWHLIGPHLRGSLRLEYQSSRPTNPENLSFIDISEFSRLDQPIKEAAIGTAFLYDRRDDPIDPHRGYYASIAGKYAFPFLRAEAQFSKFAAQGVYFQPIGRALFAVSGRVGGIFPYGAANATLNQILVPVAERFFVGGRSTERAFETDLLGIPADPSTPPGDRDPKATVDYTTLASSQGVAPGEGNCANTHPQLENGANFNCTAGPRIIGGNGFLSLNAELRFPIAGNLGGTVFYDAAQVWKSFSSLGLRFEGSDGLRQGVGLGLWYMLPIGPLRAEYAWKLSRRVIPFAIVDVTGCTSEKPCPPFPKPNPLGYSETRESPGQFYISIGFPF